MSLPSRDDTAQDEQLVAQLQSGSVEAFEGLYDRHCDRAYRIAWGICRNTGHAEDVVQEVFKSLWHSRGAYLPHHGSIASWLSSTVRCRAIGCARRDHERTGQRVGRNAPLDLASPSGTAEQLFNHDEAQHLGDLLAKLPDGQREVITLALYGQLTHTEIATQLGLPEGTIKGRMRLGLNKLREAIDRVA